MKKVKVYRVLGGILFFYGIIGYVAYVIKKVVEEAIVAAIINALFMFAFNIFLWAGLILLWRADKAEKPDEKSYWLEVIKVYIILSLIAIIGPIVYPFIVTIVYVWLS